MQASSTTTRIFFTFISSFYDPLPSGAIIIKMQQKIK